MSQTGVQTNKQISARSIVLYPILNCCPWNIGRRNRRSLATWLAWGFFLEFFIRATTTNVCWGTGTPAVNGDYIYNGGVLDKCNLTRKFYSILDISGSQNWRPAPLVLGSWSWETGHHCGRAHYLLRLISACPFWDNGRRVSSIGCDHWQLSLLLTLVFFCLHCLRSPETGSQFKATLAGLSSVTHSICPAMLRLSFGTSEYSA